MPETQEFKKSVNTLVQDADAMLRQEFGRNTAALVASAEQLNQLSQQMTANADETATQANVVSAASEQVSKNVQTVATGADEMGASARRSRRIPVRQRVSRPPPFLPRIDQRDDPEAWTKQRGRSDR